MTEAPKPTEAEIAVSDDILNDAVCLYELCLAKNLDTIDTINEIAHSLAQARHDGATRMWQPISTAPKNKSILVCGGTFRYRADWAIADDDQPHQDVSVVCCMPIRLTPTGARG